MSWNPQSHSDWARFLGLVATPLFGKDRRAPFAGEHFVLLDGVLSSLVFSHGDAGDLLQSALPAQWAWSANVNHFVVIDRNSGVLSVLRWDRPSDVREHRIASISDAQELLSTFASDRPESTTTAINRTLTTFRSLRLSLSQYRGNDLDAIRALNVLLLSADAIRRGTASYSRATLAEAVKALKSAGVIPYTASDFSSSVVHFPLGELADQLLEDCNGLKLDPYLLIRHASGTLFQEAHNLLEAPAQRRLFVELHRQPPAAKKSTKRDTRYTPATLARFLAERAIDEFVRLNPHATAIDILDPACGSGVFLVEATRASPKLASMHLRGMDNSPASAVIADFAVRQAARSETARSPITVGITNTNSLKEQNWGKPNVVLMNPPFLAWRQIDDAIRTTIKTSLGDLYEGQSDTAIAFVARAIDELEPGGVLATVIPASFLSSRAAGRLRSAIAQNDNLSVRLIGRFRGYAYFMDAAVEPAFLVISRAIHNNSRVLMVTAESGCEDRAIRAIRTMGSADALAGNGYEITRESYKLLESTDWTPRAAHATATINRWRSAGMRPSTDFFDIHLGIRVGAKRVFIISEEELQNVTTKEAQYFRPIADEIRNGRVVEGKSIFYPYRQGRLLLQSDDDLAREVPWFYQARLCPAKKELMAAKSRRRRHWWELVEPRPTWMDNGLPRILSPAFGCCGTFAYDDGAKYAVVQGVAWCWRSRPQDTEVLLAYLALFNSYEFESLLDLLSQRVSGGQYNLSKSAVANVPIPDLSQAEADVRRQLADQGRNIQAGDAYDPRDISNLVSRAYGVDSSVFSSEFPRGKLGKLQDQFDCIAKRWKIDCGHTSKLSTMIASPAYQQIIDMGMEVVPLILRELRRRPNHWFTALERITGADPVDKASRGKLAAMTKAWLAWGIESHSF